MTQEVIYGGSWKRGERISGGGQGPTFRCCSLTDTTDEYPFVIKLLNRQDDPERRVRMWIEVATLQALTHHGIAKYVDSNAALYESKKELYLVTEFIPGSTLHSFRSSKSVSIEQCAQIMMRLLDTLEHCHSLNILHRDIKPDNILLRNDSVDDPVLLDFGLSFNEELRPSGFESESGIHIGNRFLQLPEYTTRGGARTNALSDIAQMVGILFFLCTGISPDALEDENGLAPHERERPRKVISSFPVGIARKLNRIFQIGFQHEMQSRWSSISLLRTEVQQLVSQDTTRPSLSDRVKQLRQSLESDQRHVRKTLLSSAKTAMVSAAQQVSSVIQKDLGELVYVSFKGSQQTKEQFSNEIELRYKHSDQPISLIIVFHQSDNDLTCTGYTKVGHNMTGTQSTFGTVGLYDPELLSLILAMTEEAAGALIESCDLKPD